MWNHSIWFVSCLCVVLSPINKAVFFEPEFGFLILGPFIWNRRELVYKPVGQDTSLVLVKGTKESPTEESIPNSLYWQTDPVDAIQNIDIKTAKLLEETEEKLRLDFMKEVK